MLEKIYTMANETSFFETLGVADKERIHSQMIKWMFNFAFNTSQKVKFLESIFGPGLGLVEDISCETEYESIDIFIQSGKNIFLIENKLKSGEHSNQLARYSDVVMKKFTEKNVNFYFVFLTLIEEGNKEIKNNKITWYNKKYDDILTVLKDILNEVDPNTFNGIILREYVKSLENLTEVFKNFHNNHTFYPYVFYKNSKNNKNNFLKDDAIAKYINEFRFATIFQKAFLVKISNQLNFKGTKLISEQNATALLDLILHDNVKLGKHTFKIGLQFQGKTYKLFIGPNTLEAYRKSNTTWIPESTIEVLKDNLDEKNVGYFNNFNKAKRKSFYSISGIFNKELYEMNEAEIIDNYNNIIKIASEKAEVILKQIHSQNELKTTLLN